MSTAFLVASILAIGWNLVIAVLVAFTDTDLFGEETDAGCAMHHWRRRVRAEVGTLEFSAQPRSSGRRNEHSVAANRVRSDVGKTSCEVQVQVPYADASVNVMTNDGTEQRRCSVCLN